MASVTFSGKVTANDKNDRLLTLWEEYTYEFKGEIKTGKRKWTLWFMKPHGLATGDWIEVRGDLSTKSVEWTTPEGDVKHLVDHIINGPELLRHQSNQPIERDLDDASKYGDSVPF